MNKIVSYPNFPKFLQISNTKDNEENIKVVYWKMNYEGKSSFKAAKFKILRSTTQRLNIYS